MGGVAAHTPPGRGGDLARRRARAGIDQPRVVPQRITSRARTARVRHYLAAGTLEAGFRPATRQWAERLQRAGLPCRYQEWTGGHDHYWWEQQLPAALAWLLAPPSAPGPAPW